MILGVFEVNFERVIRGIYGRFYINRKIILYCLSGISLKYKRFILGEL